MTQLAIRPNLSSSFFYHFISTLFIFFSSISSTFSPLLSFPLLYLFVVGFFIGFILFSIRRLPLGVVLPCVLGVGVVPITSVFEVVSSTSESEKKGKPLPPFSMFASKPSSPSSFPLSSFTSLSSFFASSLSWISSSLPSIVSIRLSMSSLGPYIVRFTHRAWRKWCGFALDLAQRVEKTFLPENNEWAVQAEKFKEETRKIESKEREQERKIVQEAMRAMEEANKLEQKKMDDGFRLPSTCIFLYIQLNFIYLSLYLFLPFFCFYISFFPLLPIFLFLFRSSHLFSSLFLRCVLCVVCVVCVC